MDSYSGVLSGTILRETLLEKVLEILSKQAALIADAYLFFPLGEVCILLLKDR